MLSKKKTVVIARNCKAYSRRLLSDEYDLKIKKMDRKRDFKTISGRSK